MCLCSVDKLDLRAWTESEIYGKYRKLQNPLKITEIADKINEIIEGGTGGSGLVFGSTIFSLIPLTEAGLHLLDGSLLQVGGIYDEAITKISALKSSNPNLFTTEENWQSSVSSHGVCGKFVYVDGVSLRLPKVTGFVEGTLDAGALGNLVEAGLPDIYASFAGLSHISPYGAVRKQNDSVSPISGATTGGGVCNLIFEASKWNSTYGNSDAVQPQAIKGYMYIVLATSSKTDVQVNIDNVVTELNGKAGTDLANINSEGKNVIANMAMPSGSVIALTCPSNPTKYTAIADGYFASTAYGASQGGHINLYNETTGLGSMVSVLANSAAKVFVPARKGDVVAMEFLNLLENTTIGFLYAEGSRPE